MSCELFEKFKEQIILKVMKHSPEGKVKTPHNLFYEEGYKFDVKTGSEH